MSQNTKSTELHESFEMKDHPSFSRKFWRDILLCEAIALGFTYGLVVAVLNADVIDNFFYQIFKSIWF